MEFRDVLQQRHSVRAFSDKPVSEALLTELLEQATRGAPSWSNTQPYQIAIARGPVLESLREELPPRFDKLVALQRAPMLSKVMAWLRKDGVPDGDFRPVVDYPADLQPRRVATGRELYRLLGIGREDRQARHEQMSDNFRFFNAPVALFIFIHEGLGVYSALDAGIFLQSLMLAATDAGLGSCAQGALALWRSPLEQHFQLPGHYKLLCGISLGYEADKTINRFQPEKLPLADLLIAPR
ncbi:nitrobenzoate reductase [Alcanivorax hongdengensis A-11-3]|uniref:Nitrobenzoate reductase n=1 Tax=Alcanivorax hongdengensis A-11-3 TaxID=1177179 RepID=L0WI78_9GAMM|nr:nitroreductase [Alcanivorax hongdengensis]EKF75540.1 nitrobenzoate reductase [Alcanivorax hongdengensis A-11-3]